MVKRQTTEQTSHIGCRATPEACAGCTLYNCALCDGLDHESRARLVAVVDRFEVPAGEILAKEGEPPAHVIAVIDGAVMSYKELHLSRRQVTRFYFPGDLVALSGSAARADVTIKAITRSWSAASVATCSGVSAADIPNWPTACSIWAVTKLPRHVNTCCCSVANRHSKRWRRSSLSWPAGRAAKASSPGRLHYPWCAVTLPTIWV